MQLDWIDDELRRLAADDLLRQGVTRSGKQSVKVVIDGKRYVNFGSNDYLGIAADPKLESIIEKTVLRGGWGSGASPLVVGKSALHVELERRLAAFLQVEAALLFPSGYAANTGAIPAVVGKGDVIFSDAKNHASIIDGCRLSGARIVVYPHADVDTLRQLMSEYAHQGERTLIVSDALFSMDGDLAPLSELVQLSHDFEAMLMIDEAHALGVWGDEGRGIASNSAGAADVHIRVGTLSKSFGSHGGFVAGTRPLVQYLANRARSYVFSTAFPATSAAVGLAALNIMRDQPERRERLRAIGGQVCELLQNQGWHTGRSQSHIIPIVVGSPTAAVEVAAALRKRGVWIPCIRPPSVPEGESLLRLSLCSNHSNEMIDVLLRSMNEVRMEVNA